MESYRTYNITKNLLCKSTNQIVVTKLSTPYTQQRAISIQLSRGHLNFAVRIVYSVYISPPHHKYGGVLVTFELCVHGRI